MRKNYFKFLLISAMMLMTGVSFTSCGDQSDNPVDDPTEVEDPIIKETKKGAKITINKLSDIPGFLGQLSALVAEKNGGKFVLDVASYAPIEVTEGDNVLVIPNVAGSNLVINFNSELISDGTALTMKLDDKASSRAMLDDNDTVYDKKVALNLKNTDTDLILDVPGVTVTVSSLNSIQVLNGLSIVKKGASINTYVYAPKRNDVFLVNGGTESVGVYWTDDETGEPEGRYGSFPVVRSAEETEWQYTFKNIKVVKGEADYARINIWDESYKLDKLTIAEDAAVLLRYYPYIKEIVGEGNGEAKVMFDDTWANTDEKGNKTYFNDGNVYQAEKISNVTFEPYNPEAGDNIITSFLYEVPANVENVTFKMGAITFRNPQAASASVKNCKFETVSPDRRVTIIIPGQKDDINAFKITFENCEFCENVLFEYGIESSKPKLDKDGNVVVADRYEWYEFTADGNFNWRESYNEADVPEANKAVGLLENYDWVLNEETNVWEPQRGYWKNQVVVYEDIIFNNYYATIAFKDCKYAGQAMTAEVFKLGNGWTPNGAYLRFEFDGKTYRAIQMYDPEKQQSTWILIEA